MANPDPRYVVVVDEAIAGTVSKEEVALVASQLPELLKLLWEESEED